MLCQFTVKNYKSIRDEVTFDMQAAAISEHKDRIIKDVDDELYYIWYEHVQRNAMECYEFLDEYFPTDQKDISKALDNIAD